MATSSRQSEFPLKPQIEATLRQFEESPSKQGYRNCGKLVKYMKTLVSSSVDLLCQWRQRNNYSSLRIHPEDHDNLSLFQSLFTEAFDCLMKCENELLSTRVNTDSNDVAEDMLRLKDLKQQLVSKSIVVEENPFQASKVKDSKGAGEMEGDLNVVFRCLMPSYWRDSGSPEMNVTVWTNAEFSGKSKVTVAKKSHKDTRNAENDLLSIKGTFRLKGIKPMKKNECRLYVVRFTFEVEKPIAVETLPLGFYTHTTQIPILTGHILWFNAFAVQKDPCLVNLEFPDVTMFELLKVLDTEFHHPSSVIATYLKSNKGSSEKADGRRIQFNSTNEHCLVKTLGMDSSRDIVKTEQFLKMKVDREKKYTFWEWFYACYKTKRELLPELYERGLVFGFGTKEDIEKCLNNKFQVEKPGAKIFLLRFSGNYVDNHHGLISPSVIRNKDPEHGKPIKGLKYKHNEKKLGIVLLNEIGEDEDNLLVYKIDNECVPFRESFEEFKEELEEFDGYLSLNREHEGSVRSQSYPEVMPSPAYSDTSDVTGFCEMMPHFTYEQEKFYDENIPEDMLAMLPGIDIFADSLDQPNEVIINEPMDTDTLKSVMSL